MLLFLCLLLCVYAENQYIAMQLKAGTDPHAFAREHHFKLIKKIDLVDEEHSFYKFELTHASTRDVDSLDNVKWSELQVPRMQHTRVPDPLYAQQWHLHSHRFGVDADKCSNVTGKGIVIAIVDDGLQHAHPDLRDRYDALNSRNFNGGIETDPSPQHSRDGHGTAAAGVAVAQGNNGHCGRGVAPGAKVAGIRLIAGPVDDATETEALTYNALGSIDIFSCSWGPMDSGDVFGPSGYMLKLALARYVGAKRGRGGKGGIYVWAAGNGRHRGDSCAYDAYANSPYTFPIGAIDAEGKQSWYSESCSNMIGVAPSSGANKGITTIDLMGNAGYASGECYDRFGGTSSAAPLAAGIFARILEERPDLTWRDLMHVVAKAATLIQPTDASWHWNAAGYHHSDKFGFGLLKVPPLLVAARKHKLINPDQAMLILPSHVFPGAKGSMPFNFTWELENHNRDISMVEQVMIRVNIKSENRGRIVVKLVSPSGTVSVLAPPRSNDYGKNWPMDGWALNTRHFFGETQIDGTWTFMAMDHENYAAHAGSVTQLQFNLFGCKK
jgi:hypothetical protein